MSQPKTKTEAQQAQTIADKNYRYPFNLPMHLLVNLITNPFEEYAVERIRRTESIVDSQAQKIAEQAKEIERLKKEHSEFLAGIGFQP